MKKYKCKLCGCSVTRHGDKFSCDNVYCDKVGIEPDDGWVLREESEG